MDPPADGVGLQPEKLEEEKEGGPLFHCDLCDPDVVYKIAQAFLPGLASACIDNTTGGLFKTPATVAADIRREMVDYLVQRSENFMAESVVLEGVPDVEASIDPYDVISDFVDDFVSSKRNFFSRVSGWLLSDRREDWIDDFVQELELNGFWLLNRRSIVAQTLLKNLDFKNVYHCNMNFKSQEELEEHKSDCSFRTMTCSNEGCDSSFSASQMDNHDSTCPFKMLQCEQHCPEIIMRREMDRHCITTCPMKLVKCPFYSVGCQSTVPQSTIEQHKTESLSDHLLFILQVRHKEASPEDLKERVIELEKLSSPGRLESCRDARSLTFAIKDLDAKLGTIKVKTNANIDEEDNKLTDETEEKTDKPPKHVKFEKLPSEKEATVDSRSDSSSDHEDSNSHGNEESMESSTTFSAPLQPTEKEVDASISVQENLEELPVQRQDEGRGSPERVDKQDKEEVVDPMKEENPTPVKGDNFTEVSAKETHAESSSDESEVLTQSPPVKNEMPIDSPPGEVSSSVTTTESPHKEENPTSPAQGEKLSEEVSGKETHAESSSDESEVLTQSPPVKNEMPIDSPPAGVSSSVITSESPHKEENPTSPVQRDNFSEEVSVKETHAESSSDESEVLTQSPPVKNEMSIDSPPGDVSSSVTTTESPPGDVSSSVTTTESPHKEERLEPINREVGEVESTPAKEETDDSSSSSDEN